MDEQEAPGLHDLVEYVMRDLKTISSLAGKQSAWEDIMTLVQENRFHGSVYVPTIEGIVMGELDRLADDTLRVLWDTCELAVPGAVQKRPDRGQMLQDLKRCAFEKILASAGKESVGTVGRRP
jgi:hypothetical protein